MRVGNRLLKLRFAINSDSEHVRPRQGTEICNFGAPSPLEALHWISCFFSSIYVQFSKTSPLKSGESSEKSSGENRVKSCHVCGCHGFPALSDILGESQIDPLIPIRLKYRDTPPPFLRDTFEKVSPPLGRTRVCVHLYMHHHQFVSRYGSHFYRNAFVEVLVSWVVVAPQILSAFLAALRLGGFVDKLLEATQPSFLLISFPSSHRPLKAMHKEARSTTGKIEVLPALVPLSPQT